MTAADIKVNRIYRAKKPRKVGLFGLIDDRQVIWVGGDEVQYDSPTVGHGARYPKVSMDKFLKWAGSDVTGKLPKGEWSD